jgi:hypothetical protein
VSSAGSGAAAPAGTSIVSPNEVLGPSTIFLTASICFAVKQVESFAPVHCSGCLVSAKTYVAGSNFA